MRYALRLVFFVVFLHSAVVLCAQSVCVTSANPPVIRAEGLTERIGDILFDCTGTPGSTVIGNLTISLNVNLTNRLSAGSTVTGIVMTEDSGAGPQPVLIQPVQNGPNSQNSIVYNGMSFVFSPQGTMGLRIAGIRANATQAPVNSSLFAFLGVSNSTLLALSQSQLTVGTPERGLYTGFSSRLICAPGGSPLPGTLTFSGMIAAGTIFATTRVTEGFAGAFTVRSSFANLNADSGERFVVRYSGFPAGARLLVPDVIAGSDTVQPTGGGDFGVPASAGRYAPSPGGSLLLARVSGADANGAGGTAVFAPGALGSGTVAFDSVSELAIVNGAATAVYEVVDANDSVQESAQFPTFLGLAPNGGPSVQTTEDVFFAPASNVTGPSATAPIPRFASLVPPPDCPLIGDCGASYLPQLNVDTTPLQYSETAGGQFQICYVTVRNDGGGVLHWVASVAYKNGSGWLRIDPAEGFNNATVRVDALPGTLAPGAYQATLTVDAGPAAGARVIPVTLSIAAGPVPPPVSSPAITSVVSSATLSAAPVVPGSLTTIMGAAFGGKQVSATFDGASAQILFSNDSQINLVVPAELAGKTSAKLVVTVDGLPSAARTVTVAALNPAIFTGAILNQDLTVNRLDNGAARGSVIVIFATGLSGATTITGHIHDRDIAVPYYAGPAPTLPGVQQINLVVPADLPAMTTELYVCGSAGDSKVCSIPAPVTLK